MQNPEIKHWLLLAYLVAVWGFAFFLIAVALNAFHPVALVWGRLTLGAIVMLAVLWLRGGALPRGRMWSYRLVLLSVTGNVLPFTLISWAEQTVPSGEVGLLMALMPITTLVLAHWFLDNESLTRRRLVGVALGFAGVLILFSDDLMTSVGASRLGGQTAAVLATLCYALNGIYAKRMPTYDAVAISAGSLLVGAVILAAPAFWLQDWQAAASVPGAWLALACLGILATGLATWVYFTIVNDVGPAFLSTINYLIPAVAFFAGAAFLGEPAGWSQWLALALILLGVWLIQPKRKQVRTVSS